MKPALRIPLALAWTALAGVSLDATSSCSSTSQSQGGPDGASDTAPAAPDGTTEAGAMEASASDGGPVECMGIVDGAFVYFQDDAGVCPDGDTPIVI
jgi:hypothetical protein